MAGESNLSQDTNWSSCVLPPGAPSRQPSLVLGVLPGEGVGPDLITHSLGLLRTLERHTELRFDVMHGGPIGHEAEQRCGTPLPDEVIALCKSVFSRGGAILNGPGGGRYVYDLRTRLDLFFKITPLRPMRALQDACHLKQGAIDHADILLVRENLAGVYQGQSHFDRTEDGVAVLRHRFDHREDTVQRFLAAAARLARMRRGRLTVVVKQSGVPALSNFWRHCAEQQAAVHGIQCELLDVDHMAYKLVQHPRDFDVVAAPNLFGDVLADLGAVLLGSRGNSFSGNFSPTGDAVYQTNHGAAHDIAGADRANPAGQFLSLAMLLRESFGLRKPAAWIETALCSVWQEGWRTADLAGAGCRIIGTREFSDLVSERLASLARTPDSTACLEEA